MCRGDSFFVSGNILFQKKSSGATGLRLESSSKQLEGDTGPHGMGPMREW